MAAHIRYHIEFKRGDKTIRTTISLDKVISDLLALALNEKPGTRYAHSAVRQWLDKNISEWSAFDAWLPVSRQATYLAVQRIADPALVQRLNQLSE